MKINYLFIMLLTAAIGTTFSSCKKEECEVCDVCQEIPTDIKDYENTILIRFKIPKEEKVDSLTFKGIIYEYDNYDPDGAPLHEYEIKSFTVNDMVTGNYKNYTDRGEPVPGAEIIIEQEPNDDPVATSTVVHNDDGSITINVKNLDPGTYQIRCTSTSITTKGGFAVGGFNAT